MRAAISLIASWAVLAFTSHSSRDSVSSSFQIVLTSQIGIILLLDSLLIKMREQNVSEVDPSQASDPECS
jgi:hypothetical protein